MDAFCFMFDVVLVISFDVWLFSVITQGSVSPSSPFPLLRVSAVLPPFIVFPSALSTQTTHFPSTPPRFDIDFSCCTTSLLNNNSVSYVMENRTDQNTSQKVIGRAKLRREIFTGIIIAIPRFVQKKTTEKLEAARFQVQM